MKIVNPVYRTPLTSDTEAYACGACRCSSGQATTKTGSNKEPGGCGCQCDGNSANNNANLNYAHA